MKKYKAIVLVCLFFAGLVYAQDNNNSIENNNGKTAAEQDIIISKFELRPHYTGLPLGVKLGWFYRKNNFSVFPNIGTSFFIDDGPVIDVSSGLILQKDFFRWDINAAYNIYPFTMNKTASEQAACGTTSFTFSVGKVKIGIPVYAGRKLRKLTAANPGGESETKKTMVTELSSGLNLDFFLIDTGFFKSTGNAGFFIDWIPKDFFVDYRLNANVLGTFYVYHADIALMYSMFKTNQIPIKGVNAKNNYEIGKTQESITRRNSFKKLPTYTELHFFKSEIRYYPDRIKTQNIGFFLSVFADLGLGITKENKRRFLAEFGGGIGYTLFDSVPFTFQAGVNQDMNPVFFLGVVSSLSHRP
ncbi:hypothetical protein [Treponema phagedenis]|uniref:hypothetical protein n=1 Tax=Treponema phagedenis TaxID=162 RepID=UPI0015824E8D|nr:hypothetical protein [Treponema phagedenis]NVP25074.1 hypothetical protein [Treponema phagedenis]QKS91368.1 hypothetical protein HPJ96_01390 [Treponema phagedenis]QLC59229.1 hypothetical protein HW453_10820 [Treponema phagedenis]